LDRLVVSKAALGEQGAAGPAKRWTSTPPADLARAWAPEGAALLADFDRSGPAP
jgi:hypothetical protein